MNLENETWFKTMLAKWQNDGHYVAIVTRGVRDNMADYITRINIDCVKVEPKTEITDNKKLYIYGANDYNDMKDPTMWSKRKVEIVGEFINAVGNPDEVVICIGDWEQRKQMKYKEPTLGKGMRTLFRKNNYQVFLVDEFRTSCKCSNCDGGVCEKFRVRKHLNKKKDELRLIHGLLRCKSGCGLWNRDRNGSSNIYKIAKNAINKLERPSYLCRETSNQALKPSCYKQTLLQV